MASARKTKARLTKNALAKLRAKNTDLVKEQEQGLSITEEQAQTLGDELVKSTIEGFEKELAKSSPAMQNIAMRFSEMIKEFFVGFKEGVNAELKQFVKDSGKVVSNSVSVVEKAVTTNLEALKQQIEPPTPGLPAPTPAEAPATVPGKSQEDLIASILARRDADKSIVAKSTGSNVKNFLTEVALGSIGMPEKGREIVEKRQQKETFIKTEKVLRQEQFKGMSEKEIRKQLEKDYKTIQESTEKLKEIETQIQSYKEMGYSEKQIEKLGVGAEKPELLKKISAADVSRLPQMKDSPKEPAKYTEEEKQEEIQRQEVQTKENEKQTALLAEIAALLKQGSGGTQAAPTESSDIGLPSLPIPGKGLLATAAGAIASGAKKIARGAKSALGLAARNPMASKLLGGAAAVGLGAYTAYSGYQDADRQGEEKNAAIDQALKNGEITPDEALKQKEQVAAETTENKGGAVGKGTGMAVGALAGAKAGALLGSFVGPVGTVVGGLAGGAIGAISGSSVGQNIGGFIGKGVAGVKSMFGMGKPTVENTGSPQEQQALKAAGSGSKLEQLQAERDKVAKEGPATESAQSVMAHRRRLASLDKAIEAEKSKGETSAPAAAGTNAAVPTTTAAPGGNAAQAPVTLEKSANGSYSPTETGSGDKVNSLRAKATELGIDPNNASGKYEAGVLTAIVDKQTGEEYKVDVSQKDKAKVDAVRALKSGNGDTSRLENNVTRAEPKLDGSFDQRSFTPRDMSNKLAAIPPDGNGIAAAAAMGKNIVVQAPAPVVVPQGGGSQIVTQPFTTNIRNNEPSISTYLRTRY
jgi:hypothetical protein